jgi:hypothetical protein
MKNTLIIIVLWLACQGLSLVHSLGAIDHLIDSFVPASPVSFTKDFNGLRFTIDSSITCEESLGALNCRIIQSKSGRKIEGVLRFEKKNLLRTSLPLIRFKRKEDWTKQYPGKYQIIEKDYRVGVFETRLQQYTYFRLDNIFWPVLNRAFDIVVDDKSIISVTTVCDANDWLLLEKAVESIELSFTFSRTAKK